MRTSLAALLVVAVIAPEAAAERVANFGAVAGPRMHKPPPAGSMDEEAMPDFSRHVEPRRPVRPPPRRERVKKALAGQRAKHLAAFHAYRKKGVFAHDLDHTGEVYVWRDADGHLDAIAALMARDGKKDTVVALAPNMIGVHVIEVSYGDVSEWMLMSGFSLDEIDRMQRPHTRPAVVREGDTSWQIDEDARLARSYAAVESYLRSHGADGLDVATDALMQRSDLAWYLLEGKRSISPPIGRRRPREP